VGAWKRIGIGCENANIGSDCKPLGSHQPNPDMLFTTHNHAPLPCDQVPKCKEWELTLFPLQERGVWIRGKKAW
jgi:hypothetical protein